ncbi:MAG: HD domain-containing protein [Clostridia bacterium]|nr:HD domain-containing protein [Clostridia bacterium]
MDPRTFLDYLSVCERLKSEPRHCFTAGGIREYVAGHSWRIALMAMLLAPEFPELDMDRVVRMCLIHDLGEAVTGDIPTFCKTAADEAFEQRKLAEFTDMLPGDQNRMLKTLFAEMDALKTPEARFYKCLDKLEAVIQHNESDTATWTAIEYELNRHYAVKEAAAFPWLKALRDEMLKDTEQKIAEAEAANLSPANDALFG